MPGQTVGYARVSTEEQADQGESIAAQRERIRAYAKALDLPLDEVLTDAGYSAKDLKRPAMAKLLAGIKSKSIGRVIVTKLDRLTRSVADLCLLLQQCQKHDVDLISISESLDTASAVGRLLVHILGSVSQWQRESIGENTGETLSYIRRSGRVYGPIPYGYRREGERLVCDPQRQRYLRRIMEWRKAGKSPEFIAEALNEQKVPTSRGKRWYPSSVRAVLASKMAREVEVAS